MNIIKATKPSTLIAFLLLLAACGKAEGPPLHLVEYPGSHVLAIDPEGEMLLAGVGSTLATISAEKLRNPGTSGASESSTGYTQLEINAVAIAPITRTVAVGGTGQIHLTGWTGPQGGGGMAGDIDTGGPVFSLDFNSNGQQLAASTGIYDVKTAKLLTGLFAPAEGDAADPKPLDPQQAQLVRFVANGKQLLILGRSSAALHDATTGRHLQTLKGCSAANSFSFIADLNPDRTAFAFVDGFNVTTCRLIDGTWTREGAQHKVAEPIQTLTYSPDGKQLAAITRRAIFIVDAEKLTLNEQINIFEDLSGPLSTGFRLNAAPLSAVWDPKSPRLFIFRADNQIATYPLRPGGA